MKITAFSPRYDDEEAHVIRRLGAAVVAQMENLPENVRGLIIEQAVFTGDTEPAVQLKEQILAVLRKYQSWGKSP